MQLGPIMLNEWVLTDLRLTTSDHYSIAYI